MAIFNSTLWTYVEAIKGFSRALEAKDIDDTSTICAMIKLAKGYDSERAADIWHHLLAREDVSLQIFSYYIILFFLSKKYHL